MTDLLLILAILGSGGEPLVCEARADFVELNHFFTDDGKHVFDQWIWWDHEKGIPIVIAWRLERGDWRGKPTDMTLHDGDILRRVRSRFFIETWTTFDPECENRELRTKDFRRGLGGQPGEVTYRSWKQMRAKQ